MGGFSPTPSHVSGVTDFLGQMFSSVPLAPQEKLSLHGAATTRPSCTALSIPTTVTCRPVSTPQIFPSVSEPPPNHARPGQHYFLSFFFFFCGVHHKTLFGAFAAPRKQQRCRPSNRVHRQEGASPGRIVVWLMECGFAGVTWWGFRRHTTLGRLSPPFPFVGWQEGPEGCVV